MHRKYHYNIVEYEIGMKAYSTIVLLLITVSCLVVTPKPLSLGEEKLGSRASQSNRHTALHFLQFSEIGRDSRPV